MDDAGNHSTPPMISNIPAKIARPVPRKLTPGSWLCSGHFVHAVAFYAPKQSCFMLWASARGHIRRAGWLRPMGPRILAGKAGLVAASPAAAA